MSMQHSHINNTPQHTVALVGVFFTGFGSASLGTAAPVAPLNTVCIELCLSISGGVGPRPGLHDSVDLSDETRPENELLPSAEPTRLVTSCSSMTTDPSVFACFIAGPRLLAPVSNPSSINSAQVFKRFLFTPAQGSNEHPQAQHPPYCLRDHRFVLDRDAFHQALQCPHLGHHEQLQCRGPVCRDVASHRG